MHLVLAPRSVRALNLHEVTNQSRDLAFAQIEHVTEDQMHGCPIRSFRADGALCNDDVVAFDQAGNSNVRTAREALVDDVRSEGNLAFCLEDVRDLPYNIVG